ncbi:MAG: hypothetical protein KJO91_12560, partial [Gammaproteobacteria bacterium]|nr:hypothetical protein [Gammaproteobacteria bacterium]
MRYPAHIILSLLLLFATAASTAYADVKEELVELSKQLKSISHRLDRGNYEQDDLSRWTKTVIKLSSESSVCIADQEAAIKKVQESIDALGEKVKDETKEVTDQRKKLQKEKEQLDKVLAECNLFKQNSDKVSEHISLAEKSYFKEKYFIRGPHIYALAVEYLKNPFALISDSGNFFWKHAGLQEIDATQSVIDGFIVVLMIFVGIWLRRLLLRLEKSVDWIDDFVEKFVRAAITTFARYAPWLFGASTAALILHITTREITPTPFITTFATGFLIYLAFIAVVRFIFSPVQPAQHFISFTPGIPEKLSRRLHILALLSFIGYMAFYTIFSESIPELNLLLLRDVFSLLIVLNLIWLFVVLLKSPKLEKFRWLFLALIVAFALSLMSEWVGYRNIGLAGRQFIFTLFILFAVFVTVSKLFR